MCIIFLLEELLLTYLIRQFYWPQILSVVASPRIYLFPFTFEGKFYRVQNAKLVVFPFNTLNIPLHSLLVCLVSEVTSYAILHYFGGVYLAWCSVSFPDLCLMSDINLEKFQSLLLQMFLLSLPVFLWYSH